MGAPGDGCGSERDCDVTTLVYEKGSDLYSVDFNSTTTALTALVLNPSISDLSTRMPVRVTGSGTARRSSPRTNSSTKPWDLWASSSSLQISDVVGRGQKETTGPGRSSVPEVVPLYLLFPGPSSLPTRSGRMGLYRLFWSGYTCIKCRSYGPCRLYPPDYVCETGAGSLMFNSFLGSGPCVPELAVKTMDDVYIFRA